MKFGRPAPHCSRGNPVTGPGPGWLVMGEYGRREVKQYLVLNHRVGSLEEARLRVTIRVRLRCERSPPLADDFPLRPPSTLGGHASHSTRSSAVRGASHTPRSVGKILIQ